MNFALFSQHAERVELYCPLLHAHHDDLPFVVPEPGAALPGRSVVRLQRHSGAPPP